MTGISFADTVIARISQISTTFDDNSYVLTLLYLFETGHLQFIFPICVDSSGNTYVCDYDNNNMPKSFINRIFILKWETIGIGRFIFFAIIAITNSVYNLYKDDSHNIGVEKFTS